MFFLFLRIYETSVVYVSLAFRKLLKIAYIPFSAIKQWTAGNNQMHSNKKPLFNPFFGGGLFHTLTETNSVHAL